MTDDDIAAVLRGLAAERAGRTFCPSEAARRLSDDWRPLMARVRAVAAGLDDLTATQGGVEVDAASARGPIRLGGR